MKKSSMVLSCLFLTVACSKVKELDKRTESMEKSTERVSKVTDDLKETTTVMYQQIRSKEAEDTREKKFEILMGEEADMGARISAAGVYFKSFEYQLWNDNSSYDNQETLGSLYKDAANEFTRRMNDLFTKVRSHKMSPLNDHNKAEMSFYALAATLHMNHTFQEALAKEKQKKTVSFYDIMKSSLTKEFKYEPLLEHEEILMSGINREIMIELVKARVDITAALALKNLTDKREMTVTQKAKALIFKLTGGRLGSIDLPETYDKSNDATKEYTQKYLDASVKARNFLKSISVDKELDITLRSAYKKIDFNESKTDAEGKEGLVKDQKKEEIKSLINNLLE